MPSTGSSAALRELLKPQTQRFAPRSAGFAATNCGNCVRAPQHSCLQSSAKTWHWERSESEAVAAFSPSPPRSHSLSGMHYRDLFLPALYTKLRCLSPAPGSAPGQRGCCWVLPRAVLCHRDTSGLSPPCPGAVSPWPSPLHWLEPEPRALCQPRWALALAEPVSRAAHQTKSVSDHAGDPCLQTPC